MLTKKHVRWLLLLLYMGAVTVSFHLSDTTFRSLNFHTRDYAYYLQFASKLFDAQAIKDYSLNPEGRNVFFMEGVEGASNFHQSIHFEPVKYVYAILYALRNTPYILFGLIPAVFFCPVLYLALASPMQTTAQINDTLSWAILYITYPSSLMVPGYDLRPYIFLTPFFFMSLLSIRSSRPLLEQFLWFNAMFLAREEALILGAVILLYALARLREDASQAKAVFWLSSALLTWILVTFFFFHWTSYPIAYERMPRGIFDSFESLRTLSPGLMFSWGCTGVLATAVLGFIWSRLRKKNYYRALTEILSYGLVLIPLGYEFFMGNYKDRMLQLLFSPRFFLYFIGVLGLWVVISRYRESYNWIRLGMIGLAVGFLLLSLFSPYGVAMQHARHRSNIELAKPVWDLRKSLDKYHSVTLVDYATHQAFYDFSGVYAYNRLPARMASDGARYYPANKDLVQELIDKRIEYVIISRQSISDMRSFLAHSAVNTKKLFENNQFEALQIIRK